MAQGSNCFYFDVNWEICTRSAEGFIFITNRLRSALRIVSRYFYLAGPDLNARPDFSPSDAGRWERLKDSSRNVSSSGRGWKIPGEPQTVFANFGKKLNHKFHLYELWEDSGIIMSNSERDYLEPIMYSHACSGILEAINAATGKALEGGAVENEPFFGTARLCVKTIVPRPATVHDSLASIVGKVNGDFTGLYFETGKSLAHARAIIKARHSTLQYAAAGSGSFNVIDASGGPAVMLPDESFNLKRRDLSALGYCSLTGQNWLQERRFFTRMGHEGGNLHGLLWVMS